MILGAKRIPPFASRLVRHQHAGTIASIADRLRVLQSQTDAVSLQRLEPKKAGDVFRVTVVGSPFAGKEAFVNALCENTQVSEVVDEQKTLADAWKDNQVVTVKYGTEYSKAANEENQQLNISLGLEWLNNYNTEIVILPNSTSNPTHSQAIHSSDLTILVTPAASPLSSLSETEFLEKFAEKPNVLIAVNSSDSSSPSPSDLNTYISSRVAELSSTSPSPELPIFPINTHAARLAQRDPTAPTFLTSWTASGLQDVKTQILQRVSSTNARESAQNAATLYTARQAAAGLDNDLDNSLILLEGVKARVGNVLSVGLKKEEERLRRGFVEGDLSRVGEKVGGLLASLREYFSGVGLGAVVVRGDVSQDLEARVRGNSLTNAEYRMTYSIGKLNEGLYTLYARMRSELASFANDKHALSTYAATKSFQSDVSRILDLLDKQAPAKNGGVSVDAFVLKNVVASGFDVSEPVQDVQEKADQIVRGMFSSQVAIATGGVFMTYLGVPWAISIPSTALVAGAGVWFSTLRWSSAQDRFISKITEEQKTLESKLLETYDREFTRVVSDPLQSIVDMLNTSLDKRIAEAHETKAEIQALMKEINEASSSAK
ncbi:hypothetical protein HDU98_002397 [Podochytrium sp. JEL0797]|nr:hypothetical protein HDU98_002397 [Podochytrium sp. JEL0797]